MVRRAGSILSFGLLLAAMPTHVHAAECGDVTFEGQCDGEVVSWCEDGELMVADCTEIGGHCGWSSEDAFFDCLDLDDPCTGATFEGTCSDDGSTVTWCDDGEVFESDCLELERVCGWSEEGGAYDCLEEPGTADEPSAGGSSGGGGCGGAAGSAGGLWLLLALAALRRKT